MWSNVAFSQVYEIVCAHHNFHENPNFGVPSHPLSSEEGEKTKNVWLKGHNG